jgi:hypothetical protein
VDLLAIRRSELAQIQLSSFKSLSLSHPSLAFRLANIIAASAPSLIENSISPVAGGRFNSRTSIQTIAILPLSTQVPIERVSRLLLEAIADVGIESHEGMVLLNSTIVAESIGGSIFDKRGSLNLENYLTQLEGNTNVTIFTADLSANSMWTRACIKHVRDIIMLYDSTKLTLHNYRLILFSLSAPLTVTLI